MGEVADIKDQRIKELEELNAKLQRQLTEEHIMRLQAELAMANMTVIMSQENIPVITMQLNKAQAKLKELKSGPPGN